MKAKIIISGQLNDNHTLKNAIIAEGSALSINEVFNVTIITYKSMIQARQALKYACKKMLFDDPYLKDQSDRFIKGKDSLQYDASTATIKANH